MGTGRTTRKEGRKTRNQERSTRRLVEYKTRRYAHRNAYYVHQKSPKGVRHQSCINFLIGRQWKMEALHTRCSEIHAEDGALTERFLRRSTSDLSY